MDGRGMESCLRWEYDDATGKPQSNFSIWRGRLAKFVPLLVGILATSKPPTPYLCFNSASQSDQLPATASGIALSALPVTSLVALPHCSAPRSRLHPVTIPALIQALCALALALHDGIHTFLL